MQPTAFSSVMFLHYYDANNVPHMAPIDYSKGYKPNLKQKRVNIDLPIWMIDGLDKEAKRLGVERQAIMKMFLAQHLGSSNNPYRLH